MLNSKIHVDNCYWIDLNYYICFTTSQRHTIVMSVICVLVVLFALPSSHDAQKKHMCLCCAAHSGSREVSLALQVNNVGGVCESSYSQPPVVTNRRCLMPQHRRLWARL